MYDQVNITADKTAENRELLERILPFWDKLTDAQKESLAENTVFKKYGKKDENGELIVTEGNIHIPTEFLAICNEELTKLQDTEVEINAEKIPIEWLEEINLTLAEATMLEPFVDLG